MIDSNSLDMTFVRKIPKNIMPLLPTISFGYLFFKQNNNIWLILTFIVLIHLAFYAYLNQILELVAIKKLKYLKIKTEYEWGQKFLEFTLTDSLSLINIWITYIFFFMTMIILYFNLIDEFTWFLFFLGIFTFIYIIARFFINYYIGIRYKKYFTK